MFIKKQNLLFFYFNFFSIKIYLFIGIATGASCVVAPMYVSEIAETSVRGALGAFFQLFLTVGILFIYVAGAIVGWVELSVMCAIFPIILIIAMYFIPESPTYLVKTVSSLKIIDRTLLNFFIPG